MSEQFSRKEFDGVVKDVALIQLDVDNIKAWKKDEAEPMIEEAAAFKNQLKGAKKLGWLIAVALYLIAGEGLLSHIHWDKAIELLKSQTSTIDNSVHAEKQ
jgi:hypothetical protein